MKSRMLYVCSVLLLILVSGCGSSSSGSTGQSPASSPSDVGLPASPSTQPETVQDYFPIRENVKYVYQGEGNEYASFHVYIDYTDATHIQQRINNGGTETVKVMEVRNGSVLCTFRQSEVYYRENFLSRTEGAQEILFQEPIQVGTSWKLDDGSVRSITGVSVPVSTPSGAYSAVAVTTTNADGTTTDYYAKNIGLVKTVSTGDGYTVSSSLSEIQKNVPFVQTVRFFYPNINDDKLYYKDREIRFRTNDITRNVLGAAYKEHITGQPGKVFSGQTKINSLSLNRDGMVYLDLNRAFITEMNAGAGYESMILQCVANTFGSYYNAEKVVLTIDSGAYASGHILLGKGDYLRVQADGNVAIP